MGQGSLWTQEHQRAKKSPSRSRTRNFEADIGFLLIPYIAFRIILNCLELIQQSHVLIYLFD